MRTQEKNLWQWLEKAKLKAGPLLHWHRIENSVDKGTPDIEGCFVRSFVIELKSVARQPNGIVHTELDEHQAMFLDARTKAGGLAWILIQVGGDKRYLISGLYAFELLYPITEKRLETLCIKGLRTPYDVLEAAASLRFYGTADQTMHTDHGPEITRFVKPGQIIRIMQDGCLIAEITHIVMPTGQSGHTLTEHRDSPATRQNLITSGFIEEEL